MNSFESTSENETKKIAHTLAKKLFASQEGRSFFLNLMGDLGSGKTTFARFFIESWLKLAGEKKKTSVTSPTFNIAKIYGEKKQIAHLDLYRIHSLDELEQINFQDLFHAHSVCIVEWLSNINASFLKPNDAIDISFTFISENKRKIEFLNFDII